MAETLPAPSSQVSPRANARASTGPKTAQGRARSARNTFRHALSLSVYSDPHSSELRHRKHTPMAVDLAS